MGVWGDFISDFRIQVFRTHKTHFKACILYALRITEQGGLKLYKTATRKLPKTNLFMCVFGVQPMLARRAEATPPLGIVQSV